MEARIISGDRVQTHGQTSANAAHAAGGFLRVGVREDQVVALLLRNDFAFFEAALAAGLIGAYATPINWHATAEEVTYILTDSGAKVLVAHSDLLAALGPGFRPGIPVLVVPTPPEIAAAFPYAAAERELVGKNWPEFLADSEMFDGPARPSRGAMIYTSGTTGRPKGVRREAADPAQVAQMQMMLVRGYGFMPDQPMTVLMNGPMYHSAPNSYAMTAFALSANIVLQPRFRAEEMLALIEAHGVTHMHIVPTMFHRLLSLPDHVRGRYDLGSLVDAVHGAAPCPPAIKRAMIEWWGPVISEYYGSTETGLATRLTAEQAQARPGSVGRTLPGCEITVVGPDRERLPAGEVGEVFVRAGHMPDFTYHGAPDKRAEVESRGFVTVGDVGWLDEHGFLYLSDRKRDMIISGGVNIYPAEIEAAILAIPGVRDCAVFGAPDDEFGERVVAHIEPEPTASLDAAGVAAQLRRNLAGFKVPRVIEFAEALPREDSGKIFKRKLREPYWKDTDRSI
jgi:long-chain acyl-CoA synthetase